MVGAHAESWETFEAYLPDSPVLWDLHNVWSRRARLDGDHAAARRWADLERRIAQRADMISVCSHREAAELVRVSASPVITVPHGIHPPEWTRPWDPSERPVVKLFGNWSWAPNAAGLRWFSESVWPRVRRRVVADCLVAGSGATPTPGITTVGRVPSVGDFLADAWAVVVPVVNGVGAPLKYSEALACGAPVVATSDGAPFAHRRARVSDDPRVWVDSLTAVLTGASRPTQPDRTALSWSSMTLPLAHWVEQ